MLLNESLKGPCIYPAIWNKPGNRIWNKEIIWRRSPESLARSHFTFATCGAHGVLHDYDLAI